MKTQSMWVIVLVLLTVMTGAVQSQDVPGYWPSENWQSSVPEDQGLDSDKLAEGLLTIHEQGINVHSLLLVRNGSVLVDAYFYPYDGTTVHGMESVTKSVTTALIGIAADQGKLALDDPMVSFFPDRTIANRDDRKDRITVRHLASMSSGLDCASEGDEAPLDAMRQSADWVQYTLDRAVVLEPGSQFVYCNLDTHILSAILQQATGMTALDFARQVLFEPLGIQDVIWPADPQGYTHGWADLYLHPHDMAKFGYLWLNNGLWENEPIVSREWVENSVRVQMDVAASGNDYGYGWWVGTDAPPSYRAMGSGGQRIVVIPALDFMIVTTGGGFELDDIGHLLIAALGGTSPLPPNPEGVARLEAALTTVAQPPEVETVSPVPEMASEISGQTFVFEPNPLTMETLSLEFDDSAEAIMHITLGGSPMLSWPVALDGVYRLFPGKYGFPMGLRGYWADFQTFAFEYDTIANNNHFISIQMQFEGDRVLVVAQETAQGDSVTFEGSVQNP